MESGTIEDPGAEKVVVWDGITNSYRAPENWRDDVDPGLGFHEQADEDLDAVTFEVIRNRLWTINIAHGDQVTRVSGSPVFASLDFNMSILTEDGEIVQNAPFIQFLNSGAPFGVRYVLQNLSAEVGIEDGDVFLLNDPWIAAAHQMDVLFIRPVFVDGKLFAWTSNAGHQYDLGGTVPGGWPQNAVDVFHDPTIFTPLKMVSRGKLNKELERMYLRNSRMPDMVALDLRAQLSGCNFAGEQIAELVERFGAATVKGAMRRIIDNAQESMKRKLLRIPDGTWSEVKYFDHKLPGDRNTYRMQVNITKQGDRLRVDNQGTEPQPDSGPLGMAFTGLAGSVTGMLAVMLVYEQLFSVGGAERQLDWDVEPGLLTCVTHPSAVSAGIINTIAHCGAVQTCLSRMFACDPELERDAVAAPPDYTVPVIAGVNDRDEPYGQAVLDHFGMGSGARSYKDGVDSAGPSWSPLTFLLNVESVEQWYPMVYLYRRTLEDSGGAGRWRGGTGFAYAWAPYRAKTMEVVNFAGGMSTSSYSGAGLFGGYPSPSQRVVVLTETDLAEWFGKRLLPSRLEDLSASERTYMSGKHNAIPVGLADVVEGTICGGGGFGDPLDREPERVAADVAAGAVSREGAERAYGVVVDEAGGLDVAATDRRRAELYEARAGWAAAEPNPAPGPDTGATGEEPRKVHAGLLARDEDGERVLACESCGQVLCDYADDYKRHSLRDASPVAEIPGGSGVEPSHFIDQPIEFRRYCCPGCQALLTAEVVRGDEGITPEMRLKAG